jgi:nucleolar protein 6
MMDGRRINVELTAGGGGSKSSIRRDRIQRKNDKLSKERKARADRASEERRDCEAVEEKMETAASSGSVTAGHVSHVATNANCAIVEPERKRRRKKVNNAASAAEGLDGT